MTTTLRLLAVSILSLLITAPLTAQIDVDINVTVEELVQDILVGEGITVSNVMVNGMPGNQINLQAGSFIDMNSDIGLADGFIMGTGGVLLAEQTNTSGSASEPGSGDGFSFAPLEALVSVSVNDQCVIEFDFVPQGDTLTFNYVFASEEYPEFVCSNFNDVFAFFLTGPNPAGGTYDNENIALIPDPANPDNFTTTPVAINTVTPGVAGSSGNSETCDDIDPDWMEYSIYYVDNEEGGLPYQYDGNTTVLPARAIVNCGETYHISLAIGDGTDGGYDSAVFLESGSFEAQPSGLTGVPPFNDPDVPLVEISAACDSGMTIISRNCAADTTYYQITYWNNDTTATVGEDFEPLPSPFFLVPGQSDTTFFITTIIDDIEEDLEYFCPILSSSGSPDGPFTILDTVCIPMIDAYQFPLGASPIVLRCPESVPVFEVTADGMSQDPYDLFWILDEDTVSTDNPFTAPVPPNFGDTITYDLYAIDRCGAVNFPQQTYVTNRIPDEPTADITQPGQFCPGLDYPLQGHVQNGTSPFSWSWFSPTSAAPSDSSVQVITPQIGPINANEDGRTYFVTVTDNCNPGRSSTDSIIVDFPEPLNLTFFADTVICTSEELDLSTVATGGYQPYVISYDFNGIAEITVEADPNTGEGIAYDFLYDGLTPENNVYDISVLLDDQCTLEGGGQQLSIAAYYSDSALVETEVTSLFCIVPNVITPNGDEVNDRFEAIEMINKGGRMHIYNRWGNELESTSNYFYEFADDQPAGTYFYVIDFADGDVKKGSFTLMR